MAFSLTLTFQYVNKYLSSGNDQGMENILKLSNFPKSFEKRAWRTHNAPKPANENFENHAKIWRFHWFFDLPISQRVFVEWQGSRYEKCSTFFELFENVWKKGLVHPQCTQICKWRFWKWRVNKYLSSGNDQGMESVLKFSNFSKIFEKRAWHTHNAPKPGN